MPSLSSPTLDPKPQTLSSQPCDSGELAAHSLPLFPYPASCPSPRPEAASPSLCAACPRLFALPCRREAAEGAPGQAQLYRHQGNSRTFLALADSSHVAAPDCFLWTRAFFQGAAPARYLRCFCPRPLVCTGKARAVAGMPILSSVHVTCVMPGVPSCTGSTLRCSSSPYRVLIFGPLPPGPFHSQLRIATGQEDIAGSVFRLCTAAHQVRTHSYAVRRVQWAVHCLSVRLTRGFVLGLCFAPNFRSQVSVSLSLSSPLSVTVTILAIAATTVTITVTVTASPAFSVALIAAVPRGFATGGPCL